MQNKYLFLLLVFIFSCKSSPSDFRLPPVKNNFFEKAAVVSACSYASEIGNSVLKQGGNAVDAAIAVQFALAVTYPVAGNIGGGGFMIYKESDGNSYALDFRETAPSSASKDMYLDDEMNVIKGESLLGQKAAGIPGSVDGMVKAFNRFSKLKNWEKLIMPSYKLAKDGIYISQKEADRLNRFKDDFLKVNDTPNPFVKSTMWKEGDKLVQTDLANTLHAIAQEGEDGFYKGWVAQAIEDEMKSGNGLINLADLESYEAVWREPLITDYRGYQIISMPPPSSGGIALNQLLQSVEKYDLKTYKHQSVEHIHLYTEAQRRVYADRASHLGDPEFHNVPVDTLLTESYNEMRMHNFDPNKASVSEETTASNLKDSEQTTHFSILDEYGNAVSLTTTINTAYGSKVWVDKAGFFLNNEMDDFSAKPGEPNYFGLIGNEANSIAPGKRMLSSMCPAIVSKDGLTKIIVGSPGGSTIITSVFQVITSIIDFGMNANDATQVCRFHSQWLPDLIYHEAGCISDSTRQALREMGHELKERSDIGKVETILISDKGIEAAADRRGDDSASGY